MGLGGGDEEWGWRGDDKEWECKEMMRFGCDRKGKETGERRWFMLGEKGATWARVSPMVVM